MSQELNAIVKNDTNALTAFFSRFQNIRPMPSEVEAIKPLLHPNARFLLIDSITSGCPAKLDEERSKFIIFQEFVCSSIRGLKVSAGTRQIAAAHVIELLAKHGFCDAITMTKDQMKHVF